MCEKCGAKKYPNAINSEMMRGITVSEGICTECGKLDVIIPLSDFDRAERHARGEYIHPFEWD